jgi:hypothetical protein
MKWKTLITTLVLGATTAGSVAVAQPTWGGGYWRHRRPHYNRVPPAGDMHEYDAGRAYGWIPPNYPAPYNGYNGYNGYQSGSMLIQGVAAPATQDRQDLHVGPQFGRFSQLTLQLTSGATFITGINVVLPGDRHEILRFSQWLSPRNPTLTINLPRNEHVDGLIVYTQGGAATYDVLGQ